MAGAHCLSSSTAATLPPTSQYWTYLNSSLFCPPAVSGATCSQSIPTSSPVFVYLVIKYGGKTEGGNGLGTSNATSGHLSPFCHPGVIALGIYLHDKLPTHTVVCPSGSSSCRDRYHMNWFSINLALFYFCSVGICMGKIGIGRVLSSHNHQR